MCLVIWPVLGARNLVEAANPYLPLWEHIPDGEPRLFEDPDNPGKYRVYLYGSHDTRKYAYCGYDIPVWSAPVEDLNDWRYDGIGFQSIVNGVADVLFAPDVVVVEEEDGTKTYYLYPNNQGPGRGNQVAKSKRPDGPFEVINWNKNNPSQTEGIMGFDPAVFVDDDGRVYGYWGFLRSFGAELDPTNMYSAKPGTRTIVDLIGNCEQQDGNPFRYFEAPSLRKVEDKYVLVFSRKTKNGEYGLGESNSTLAYAYSDGPLGPWTYGGTIVDARGPEIGENGRIIGTQPSHNTHGGILEVNGQWYIFYHRSTNNSGFARQAMVEPINVSIVDDRVEITGTRIIKDAFGNEYTGAEITSQGFEIDGLDPYKYHPAGINCYLLGGAYVKATYDTWLNQAPVINIRNNSVVGFKYFNFPKAGEEKSQLEIYITPKGFDGTIEVMLDSPWEKQGGTSLGVVNISKDLEQELTKLILPVPHVNEIEGKHGIYFIFRSDRSNVLCDFNGLKFSKSPIQLETAIVGELDEWDLAEVVGPKTEIYVNGELLDDFAMSDHDYNFFQYTYLVSSDITGPPIITAKSEDNRVKVHIEQPKTLLGTAIVQFTKGTQTKTYEIQFSTYEVFNFSNGLPEDWDVLHPADSNNPLAAISTSENTVSIKTYKPDWEYPHSRNILQIPLPEANNWALTVEITTDQDLKSMSHNTQVGLGMRNVDSNDFYGLSVAILGDTVKAKAEGKSGSNSFKNVSDGSLNDVKSFWLRLVKRGDSLQGYYSRGNQADWISVGNPVAFDAEFSKGGVLQLFASNQSFRTDLEAAFSVSLTVSD